MIVNLGIIWVLYGYYMGIIWVLYGYYMGIIWVYNIPEVFEADGNSIKPSWIGHLKTWQGFPQN